MAFKVLVVDDSKLARMAVAKVLGGFGLIGRAWRRPTPTRPLPRFRNKFPTSWCWTSTCLDETD